MQLTQTETNALRRYFWRWYATQDPEKVVIRRLIVVPVRVKDLGAAFRAIFGGPPAPPMA